MSKHLQPTVLPYRYIPLLSSKEGDVCTDDETPPLSMSVPTKPSTQDIHIPPSSSGTEEMEDLVYVEPKDCHRPYKRKRQDSDDSLDSDDVIDLTQEY